MFGNLPAPHLCWDVGACRHAPGLSCPYHGDTPLCSWGCLWLGGAHSPIAATRAAACSLLLDCIDAYLNGVISHSLALERLTPGVLDTQDEGRARQLAVGGGW